MRPRVTRAVLDASAVLVALYGEPGAGVVDAEIRGAAMSAVNAAEVISKLVERGMTAKMAASALIDTGVEIVEFDLDQATIAGHLRTKTKSFGFSLGDRACLALAQRIKGRAITADQAWAKIEGLGIEIEVLR